VREGRFELPRPKALDPKSVLRVKPRKTRKYLTIKGVKRRKEDREPRNTRENGDIFSHLLPKCYPRDPWMWDTTILKRRFETTFSQGGIFKDIF
jgi:hypothetical protein